ncbi:MAG: hypothetical protein IKU39_03740 [Lachnospiraceae bacterium]|nr:hypothetical protein [Lachnospiraceae bacterium]
MKFTFDKYKTLVEMVYMNGYKVSNYLNWKENANPCIFRHDVDYDLKKAFQFAEMESEIILGDESLKSTYFVLLSSDFYNLFSKENIRIIKQIRSLGHDVGLHFDEKKYMDDATFDKEKLVLAVNKEVEILSELLGEAVASVSMHRPSKAFLESDIQFDKIINSYGYPFFQKFKYLSDSRMHWRENVESIVENKQYNALHILTHPFWYNDIEMEMHDILKQFIKKYPERIYESMNDNFRDLETVLLPEEVSW